MLFAAVAAAVAAVAVVAAVVIVVAVVAAPMLLPQLRSVWITFQCHTFSAVTAIIVI